MGDGEYVYQLNLSTSKQNLNLKSMSSASIAVTARKSRCELRWPRLVGTPGVRSDHRVSTQRLFDVVATSL